MKCNNCIYSPEFFCRCQNEYICVEHLGTHYRKDFNHYVKKLSFIPNEQAQDLKHDILNRIKSLNKTKSYVLIETNNLIKTAKNCAKSVCEKIDEVLHKHFELLKFQRIFQEKKEEIQRMLKKDFALIKTGLKLDSLIKDAYEIISNELPSNNWVDHKKNRYLEMTFEIYWFSADIKISADGKMLFQCKRYAGNNKKGTFK